MSLPPATKQSSSNPAKNAVADPTNKQELDADVNRKLKLYGVIQAFRAGRMPDNAQIDETLKWVIQPENSPIDVDKLSDDGKKLINDLRSIIETARVIVQEKNSDELFQNFVAHTSGVDVQGQGGIKSTLTPEEAKSHGNQAVQHMRTLLQLLLTNSETRKLLSDFTIIGRDLFATGAATAASRIRPTDEQLRGVDDAAPASEWKDGDASLNGTAKDLADDVQAANTASATTAPKSASAVNGTEPVPTTVTPAATANGATAATTPETTTTTVVNPDGTTEEKKTLKSRVQALTGRVPEKHRTTVKENATKTKDFLTKQYFPKERRDQFIWRLKKVVVECQSHPQYRDALVWFLDTLKLYFDHAKNAATSGGEQGKQVFGSDPLLQEATNELRTLLERFANGASMSPIFDAIRQIAADAKEDPVLDAWINKVNDFSRKSLLEPGFILSPQFDTQSRAVQDEGKRLFNEGKYKGHRDNLVNQVTTFFKAFAEDPLNKRFGDTWNTLTKDLLFDSEGKLAYKPHLWKDIRAEILPSLVQKVGYVPIPRIEYTDEKLDLVIENLTLQGRNLFPNVMEININNHIKVSPYSDIKDSQNHTLTLTLAQIQADMRDVAFYFRQKKGVIKLKDSGLADVFLGGQGITATIKLHSQGLDGTGPEMRGRVFKVKDVKVKIDTLKFAIRDSNHALLYKTLKPLATGLIKKQISKALSDAIKTGLEAVDDQLVQVRTKMSNESNDPSFSRVQALKSHISSKRSTDASSESQSVRAAKRNSQFKIVPKGSSMILPDVGYEKGWIKRQAERDESVSKGEGWKSAAFTIVPNANATTTVKSG